MNFGKSRAKLVTKDTPKITFADVAGCRRGGRGAPGDQGVPRRAGQVPGGRRQDPQGRAALRPARHRQDPARPRGRRRGGRAVLLDLRLGLRRDVRRCRRQPRARPVRAGQDERAGDRLRRRDRRRRPAPWCRPRRRSRRARADPQPAARRDGRLRRQDQRHPDRGDQPPRHPRPGAAAPGPLRPPDRRRRARTCKGRHADPRGARQGQADGAATSTCCAVARRTPGFTGADLANVLNEAALLTARTERASSSTTTRSTRRSTASSPGRRSAPG